MTPGVAPLAAMLRADGIECDIEQGGDEWCETAWLRCRNGSKKWLVTERVSTRLDGTESRSMHAFGGGLKDGQHQPKDLGNVDAEQAYRLVTGAERPKEKDTRQQAREWRIDPFKEPTWLKE